MFNINLKYKIPLIFTFFLFLSSRLSAQTEIKHYHQIIICDEKDCGFATYYYDSTQVSLPFSDHKRSIHNNEVDLVKFNSLPKQKDYLKTDNEIKIINCPYCNDYFEASRLFEEIKMHLNLHTTLVHQRKLEDEEVKRLIK